MTQIASISDQQFLLKNWIMCLKKKPLVAMVSMAESMFLNSPTMKFLSSSLGSLIILSHMLFLAMIRKYLSPKYDEGVTLCSELCKHLWLRTILWLSYYTWYTDDVRVRNVSNRKEQVILLCTHWCEWLSMVDRSIRYRVTQHKLGAYEGAIEMSGGAWCRLSMGHLDWWHPLSPSEDRLLLW